MSKTYYKGGCRVVVDGVPIRLARKPSAESLRDLRTWERSSAYEYETRTKRAQRIANDAIANITTYAEMLGRSYEVAEALIVLHREHIAKNPLVDLSLEYDL